MGGDGGSALAAHRALSGLRGRDRSGAPGRAAGAGRAGDLPPAGLAGHGVAFPLRGRGAWRWSSPLRSTPSRSCRIACCRAACSRCGRRWARRRGTGPHRRQGRCRVQGKIFYDHPRIVHAVRAVAPRKMYLYTTMYFEDGSGLFGYHAVDERDRPIPYYCFGVYIDPAGKGSFLPKAQTQGSGDRRGQHSHPVEPGVGGRRGRGRGGHHGAGPAPAEGLGLRVRAAAAQRLHHLSPGPGRSRPRSAPAAGPAALAGYGLAEYFNAEHWPA